MSVLFTCVTCRAAFADPDRQREHYKTDWHRYNLKRKVAEMPPVSGEFFNEKVMLKRFQMAAQEEAKDLYCQACNKHFQSQNALDSHVRSKKHKEMEASRARSGGSQSHGTKSQKVLEKSAPADDADSDKDSDIADADSDAESWDGTETLGLEECLFCPHISLSLETNVDHMTVKHSFFLPDAEYISDLEGLIVYLGEKISQGHMCLWCNDHSKMFYNMRDVQKHMVDKGHCKMQHDDQTMYEYADYYDYRSSYPDSSSGETQAEGDVIEPDQLVSSGYELVLPSGSSIGHRSLARYYRQNLGARRRETKTMLSKVLAGYRALGWTGATGTHMEKRAKDMQFLQRLKTKHHMQLGVKANKLQRYFRDPTM